MNRSLTAVMLSALGVGPILAAWSPEADDQRAPAAERPAKTGEESNAAEKRMLRSARQHVARLAMRIADESNDEVKLVERPLLAYGEPSRGNNHGTLWAFGAAGRPAAFLELFQSSELPAVWFQSLIRSGDQPLLLQAPDGKRWEPPRGPAARLGLENAPPPAESAAARLRQLKSLARRFTAHEIWDPDNSRYELRLLVQPVYRYDDAAAGVQDGAAFVFAHGTNPELIVLLEALGESVQRARWRYSAFPSSSAEVRLEIDGREVWTRPRAPNVVGRPTDDYWLFTLPVDSQPPPEEKNASAGDDRTGAAK